MMEQIAGALVDSGREFATGVAHFVPRLIAALIILALGWVLAIVVRYVARRIAAWLGVDRFATRTGASEMLRGAELPSANLLIATILFWVIWIGAIVVAIDALEFQPLNGLAAGFVRFVPRLLVALLIVGLGFVVANVIWRAALLASVNAGLPSARLFSGALRLLVIAVSVILALEQIGLATAVVLTTFAIAFGAVMLGLAIAFGLGGRDAARQVIEQQMKGKRSTDTNAAPHL
jgi:hypothetical protein